MTYSLTERRLQSYIHDAKFNGKSYDRFIGMYLEYFDPFYLRMAIAHARDLVQDLEKIETLQNKK